MGWTLEERRDRVVDAALELAADQGVEHVNLRAAAHSAGMSWDAAQGSFDDHADLLQAMSSSLDERHVGLEAVDLTMHGSLEEDLESVALQLWTTMSARREFQLVSYELAMLALRRTMLRPLVSGRYDRAYEAALTLLGVLGERHGVTWSRPAEDIARFAATFLDGVCLAWVVDRDSELAESQVRMLAHDIGMLAKPA
ncbi:TetR/AcrR family transcriptional regulator [Sanguibacter antarcticus]|uniref:TetR family transcriptional regulator n=1 Tax=Sanguibacter antarcticus TaxID=372484 RepID=A0A2A9E8K4_9MICO|nr:hypothetical protein [Sanguibacter antarcticus]PFG35278.1 TetR family transcriptional regulator [Sanguibacter antarcticus]